MLGKCIKNEFVNRTKQALGIIFALIGMALLVRIADTITSDIDNGVLRTVFGFLAFAYVITIIAGIIMAAFLPFLDFRTRFYKDQAYLTHTLPVKTSTILVARMVCDIVLVISISISWVLSLCIAFGDAGFYKELVNLIEDAFSFLGGLSAVETSKVVLFLILFVVGTCLTTLNTIWTINAAYSFGHSFSKNKKIMSVVGFIGLYIFAVIFLSLVLFVLDEIGVVTNFEDIGVDSLSMANTVLFIMDLIAFSLVFIMGAVTNYICKKHLNVE